MRNRESVIRIVALSLLIYAVLSALGARFRITEAEKYVERLCAEQSLLEEENRRLALSLAEIDSNEQLIRLARERLGLVMPDETIFYFITDREDQK